MKKTKKIIITGAAGLVGQNLIPLLVERKYDIIAIDKHKKNLDLLQKLNSSIECLNADVSVLGDWQEKFKDASCVIELHAQIASQKPEVFLKSNVVGVNNVIDVCKKNKIKNLIHISS